MSTDTPPPPRKQRVAVVFGGRSGEHAVSCMTAAGVLRALDRTSYDVVPLRLHTSGRWALPAPSYDAGPLGIPPSGLWLLAADEPARYELTDGRLPEVTPDAGPQVLVP